MNVVNFEDGQCKRIRPFLDSYLNNELLVETNHELRKHLESCPDCRRALDERSRVKLQLKRAVVGEEAPPRLQQRILRDIRRSRRAGFLAGFNASWALAAAAAVVVFAIALGVFVRWNRGTGAPASPTPRPLSMAANVEPGDVAGEILKIGFDDHVFCAIDHEMAGKSFTAEQMSERLGPQYSGLIALVKERMPQGYTVVVGHRCHYQKREFIHLILRKQDAVVSLVITRKNGEAFPQAGAASVMHAAGVPIYEASWRGVQVAGMETHDYLAFVVSNETKSRNGQIASSLAAAVGEFLKKAEA